MNEVIFLSPHFHETPPAFLNQVNYVQNAEVFALSSISRVIAALEEKMPEDCATILDEYYRKLAKDILRMGFDKAIEKWLNYSEDATIIEDNP